MNRSFVRELFRSRYFKIMRRQSYKPRQRLVGFQIRFSKETFIMLMGRENRALLWQNWWQVNMAAAPGGRVQGVATSGREREKKNILSTKNFKLLSQTNFNKRLHFLKKVRNFCYCRTVWLLVPGAETTYLQHWSRLWYFWMWQHGVL